MHGKCRLNALLSVETRHLMRLDHVREMAVCNETAKKLGISPFH